MCVKWWSGGENRVFSETDWLTGGLEENAGLGMYVDEGGRMVKKVYVCMYSADDTNEKMKC